MILSRLFGFFGMNPVNLSCSQHAVPGAVDGTEGASSQGLIEADGWGIGFFRNNGSFLFKKAARSSGVQRIASIGEVISSHIFISHLRKATVGERKEANTQPFRWGNWLLAHQGTISPFRKIRPRILRKLPSAYKKQICGNTDSEHCFYLFLTMLRGEGGIKKGEIPLKAAVGGLKKCIAAITGFYDDAEIPERPTVNLLLSNGAYLLAARQGIPLFYLLQSELDAADMTFFSRCTGLQYTIMRVEEKTRFVLIASEKLSASANWRELPENHIIAVDSSLNIDIVQWLESPPDGQSGI